MHRVRYIFFISLLSMVCSFFYFSYNHRWIIIQNPFKQNVANHSLRSITAQKKVIKHFFWHHDAWRQELAEILWSDDAVHAVSSLVTSWLSILEAEKINAKKISLQSVAPSATQQEIFCSFDRNPFSKHQSTYEKLMWIEGLLKSIRENGIKIQAIRFLVHHQPLLDTHLDFSNSWPVQGFLSESS